MRDFVWPEFKTELARLEYSQKYIKHQIKRWQRTIGWEYRKYQADIKHNSIQHPKLDLTMVLVISVPSTSRYQREVRKWTKELEENTKRIKAEQRIRKKSKEAREGMCTVHGLVQVGKKISKTDGEVVAYICMVCGRETK